MSEALQSAEGVSLSANPFNLSQFLAPVEGDAAPVPVLRDVLVIASGGETRGRVGARLEEDFEVTVMDDADKGLACLREKRFALVVLDVRDSTRTSVQLADEIRLADPEASVMVLTAATSVRVDGEQCIHVPFDSPEIIALAGNQAAASLRRRSRSTMIREMEGFIGMLQQELQAKDSIASYGEASASMVHDLRNALFSTLGYTARLIHETAQLKTTMPDKIGPIDHIAKQLEHTSNYLFHLSQTCRYTDEGAPRKEKFDLLAEAQHVHRVLFFNSPNIRIEGVTCLVKGDRFELHRVFQNLIKNAFEAGATEVTVTLAINEGRVDARVTDNGPGFAPADAEVVFQRALPSSKRGGQGLGLRICHKIVHRHGGELVLVSSSAGRTVFGLTLPVV